jgi:hypothetical protein
LFVNQITITREGYYGGFLNSGGGNPEKPFKATIEVQGQHGKVELQLSSELSKRVVDIIADEVAAAGRATAEAMVASMLTVEAKPALEAPEGEQADANL